MELKTLRTFLMVADVGTVVEAAKRLHCVQSNVTTRIKTLEDELGVSLFVRSRSGMTLTAAGQVLVAHARNVVRAERDAKMAMTGLSRTGGLVRVGSMESTIAPRLPPCIAAFQAIRPDAEIELTAAPTEDLIALLISGRVDVALIGGNFAHPDLVSEPVFQEEMVLLTHRSVRTEAQAREKRLIVFRSGCSYRAFSETWLKANGLAPNAVMEMGTLDGILGCVASGVGVTLLPRSVAETSLHRANVTVHDLVGPERFIDTCLIHRTGLDQDGIMADFRAALKNVAPLQRAG